MQLTVPYIPEIEKTSSDKLPTKTNIYYRIFIETEERSYSFVSERKFEEFTLAYPTGIDSSMP